MADRQTAAVGRRRPELPRCAVLIPVLGRPDAVAPVLESIQKTSDPERVRAVFIASPADRDERAAIRAAGADLLVLDREPGIGDYAAKINLGYRETDEELLFTGADDLRFRANWLEFAVAKLRGRPRVGVVGTNDLGSRRVMRGDHSTHSLVTRRYADERGTVDGPGAVLAECYRHNFVDDELVQTAKSRGAFLFARAAIVEHLHPHWGKGKLDATYRLGTSTFDADRQVFRARQERWGGRQRR